MPEQTMEAGNVEGAIWGRLLRPEEALLSPAAARVLLELEFPAEDKARMHELAAKARAGTLTTAEQAEVESYSRVGSILGVLKSKARRSLRKNSRAGRSKR